MDESSKSRREETREFWEAAIRLWQDSGLSVREFCTREGLAEHTFYARRRELLPESTASEAGQESSGENGDGLGTDGRRRRKRKHVAAGDLPDAATPFIELLAPAPTGFCHCTLELEDVNGAKMRIQLRSVAAPDLAAISRSFYHSS